MSSPDNSNGREGETHTNDPASTLKGDTASGSEREEWTLEDRVQDEEDSTKFDSRSIAKEWMEDVETDLQKAQEVKDELNKIVRDIKLWQEAGMHVMIRQQEQELRERIGMIEAAEDQQAEEEEALAYALQSIKEVKDLLTASKSWSSTLADTQDISLAI